MTKLFFTLLIAAPMIASAKLYLVDELPEKPLRLENVVKSLPWVTSARSGDKCSGFFISEDGYYVTALHCIETCLNLHHLFVNSDPTNEWDHAAPISQSDFHKIFNTASSVPKTKTFCEDEQLTFPEKWELYGNPELVMIGRGWATVKSDGIDQLSEEQFQALQNGIDDFAILKYEVPRKMSCLKVSTKNQKGTSIWTLGFPTETSREEGFNSDGRSRYGSMGTVRGSLREDDYLRTLPMSDLDWQRQEQLTQDPKYLLMTNDVVSQMSGGTVVDDQGDAVALIYSSNARDSLTKPFWGTSFGMRLDYIRDRAQQALGKDVFSCP